MSCERNPNKYNNTAGTKSGVSAAQGKFNSAAGKMVTALTRRLGRAATTALRVTESFDSPSLNMLTAVPVALEAGALLAAMYTGRKQPLPKMSLPPGLKATSPLSEALPAWAARWAQKQGRPTGSRAADPARTAGQLRQRAILAVGLLKLGQATTTFAGTGLARLSRQREPGITAGLEQQFFFPNSTQRPVRVWQSRLTPLLNRVDAGPSQVQRSDGMMVEWQGKSWHRGTTVVKTNQGERTITHLQSLTLPATHYYFNRRLGDNETVGLITGQKGFEPKTMVGYVGQVGEVESLLPAWAQTKRGLILAHLRWDEQPAQQGAGQPVHSQTAEAAPAKSEAIHPLDGVKARVTLAGQDYPALVRRVVAGPAGRPLAEATYYDDGAGVWKAVEDEAVQARLAEQVEAGQIEVWDREEQP